ncbi:hypothetical protein F0562_008273 [Nyssa sinensis]|uniref:Uncharacterized protein n=1 Tax=Nyssa sinensis TaxID=561372 RepID=A0A5J5A8H9_9ASTE|nr:hypothetical protein F0562_008273 [Nyssa sinensis]
MYSRISHKAGRALSRILSFKFVRWQTLDRPNSRKFGFRETTLILHEQATLYCKFRLFLSAGSFRELDSVVGFSDVTLSYLWRQSWRHQESHMSPALCCCWSLKLVWNVDKTWFSCDPLSFCSENAILTNHCLCEQSPSTWIFPGLSLWVKNAAMIQMMIILFSQD